MKLFESQAKGGALSSECRWWKFGTDGGSSYEKNIFILVTLISSPSAYRQFHPPMSEIVESLESLCQKFNIEKSNVAAGTELDPFGRSIKIVLSTGSALAFTSAFLDFSDQRIKHDDGKEYAAYTTKKRTSNDA